MREDEGESGEERDAEPYEFSGGESSSKATNDEGEGDDERTDAASGSSGSDDDQDSDSEDDQDSDNEPKDDQDSDDEPKDDQDSDDEPKDEQDSDDDQDSDDEPKDDQDSDDEPEDDQDPDGDDERTAPAYEFSGGESSGEDGDGGDPDEEAEEEDDDEPAPAPVTAATTQWHPTREDQKKALREEREAKAAEDAKRAKRSSRLKRLGVVAAVAAVIVLIGIAISSMGEEEATTGGSEVKGPVVGAGAIEKRFQGVEQDGLTLGNPKAPVTLVEFADLQCPFCKKSIDSALPSLVDRYVRTGKVRIEFRNYAILGPDSEKAARALAAAADQGKAWQFLDLWYLNQGEENSGYVTDEYIRKIASGVRGLDAERVVQASNATGATESVAVANTEAQKFGITQTPSLLIGRTGQERTQLQLQDPANPDLYGQAIDRVLASSGE